MVPMMCIVQEGQISSEVASALKSEFREFAQRAFDAAADIDWIEVPRGSGFTAALPSRTIIASVHANRSLNQAERVSLLKELCGICMNGTGRSANEVVTSIRDPR